MISAAEAGAAGWVRYRSSIELLTETLAITATEGQFLVIHHAEPGSPSQHALTRLAAKEYNADVTESMTNGSPMPVPTSVERQLLENE